MQPNIKITSNKFVYVSSANTNIRERFERIRAEQKQKRTVDNIVGIAAKAWGRAK
jgi:Uri superfamily endonuclease